jgi:uncharacterized protein
MVLNAMSSAQHIIVMAKAPVAGFAKTRLIPLLGPQGAADAQRQFTERAVQTANQVGVPVELCCAGDEQSAFFADLRLRHPAVRFTTQVEGDLGVRMYAAFSAANNGASHIVMMGTDCPSLLAQTLRDAFDALQTHDAVLAPAEDGGYVLIGLSVTAGRLQKAAAIFDGMPWSQSELFQATLVAAQRHEISLAVLPTHYDIDTPDDYLRWQAQCATPSV